MRRNVMGRHIFDFDYSFWQNVVKSSCLIGKFGKSVYRNRNSIPIEIDG